jgi:hypothetical protein
MLSKETDIINNFFLYGMLIVRIILFNLEELDIFPYMSW